MYYRRKVLLALLEVYGGSLKRTDCEKLLFNFCQATEKNHYDFFPYKYGPFSFMSYFDKRRLTELGLLKTTDDFQIDTEHSYLDELEPADKRALLNFKANVGTLHGDKLVKKLTASFPNLLLEARLPKDYLMRMN